MPRRSPFAVTTGRGAWSLGVSCDSLRRMAILIDRVEFLNLRALRQTTLPLGPFTLIVGANGSGKSTALQALELAGKAHDRKPLRERRVPGFEDLRSVGDLAGDGGVEVRVLRGEAGIRCVWLPGQSVRRIPVGAPDAAWIEDLGRELERVSVFVLNAEDMRRPVQLGPAMELSRTGGNLAGVLDRLRDDSPERFETLNAELHRALPEYDRVLFGTPSTGHRGLQLRTTEGLHPIGAMDLSQGTLLTLAILTLAHLPAPPSIICLEEPDHGLHPRLLRQLQDSLYRLSHPGQFGETRSAVQVIATTHSPYFLDLFRDHPEEIVIAEKVGLEARFTRLVDRPDIDRILVEAPLGDAWYSGVLSGVPGE